MANVEELLQMAADTEDTDDELSYVIDEHLRVIAVPERGVVLGVEGDKDVNRVRFAINRYYHGSDLSDFTIRINYENAEGDRNYFTVTEKTVDEAQLGFIWTVDSDAAAYKGTVRFVVNCFTASEDGVIDKAYHTTIGTASVLEGMEVDATTDTPEVVDLLTRLEHDLGVYAGQLIAQAESAASNAAQSKDAAANSAAAAKTSETNAASSAAKAAGSESAAKTSETNASTSEKNAANSASAAKTSETNAAASATKAAGSENAAKTSETNASASEKASADSASAAKASETKAAAQAGVATNKATAAANSATAAQVSEKNSASNASAAKTSEANAKLYSEQVQTIVTGYKGWYQDEAALAAALPTGKNGDWVILGSSDSIWVWDGDSSKWKCAGGSEGTLNAMTIDVPDKSVIDVPDISQVTSTSVVWVRLGRLKNTSDKDIVRIEVEMSAHIESESNDNGTVTNETGSSQFGRYKVTISDRAQTDTTNLASAYDITDEINVYDTVEHKIKFSGVEDAASSVSVQEMTAEDTSVTADTGSTGTDSTEEDDPSIFTPVMYVLATNGGDGTSCADVWLRLPCTMHSESSGDDYSYSYSLKAGFRLNCIWYGKQGTFEYDVAQTTEMPSTGTNCTERYEIDYISSGTLGDGVKMGDNDMLTLAPASSDTIGGVKVGNGLSVAADGTVSANIAKAGSGLSVSADGTVSTNIVLSKSAPSSVSSYPDGTLWIVYE